MYCHNSIKIGFGLQTLLLNYLHNTNKILNINKTTCDETPGTILFHSDFYPRCAHGAN